MTVFFDSSLTMKLFILFKNNLCFEIILVVKSQKYSYGLVEKSKNFHIQKYNLYLIHLIFHKILNHEIHR